MSEQPTKYTTGVTVQRPARRRPSGQTLSKRRRQQAQRLFLQTLEETANVAGACRTANVSRTIAYAWRRDDPDFAAAWQESLDTGLDELEGAAFKRAMEGDELLIMFLLKAHRPEVYRETVAHEHTGAVAVGVVFQNDWRREGLEGLEGAELCDR